MTVIINTIIYQNKITCSPSNNFNFHVAPCSKKGCPPLIYIHTLMQNLILFDFAVESSANTCIFDPWAGNDRRRGDHKPWSRPSIWWFPQWPWWSEDWCSQTPRWLSEGEVKLPPHCIRIVLSVLSNDFWCKVVVMHKARTHTHTLFRVWRHYQNNRRI